jgi:hypothetical protein
VELEADVTRCMVLLFLQLSLKEKGGRLTLCTITQKVICMKHTFSLI